MVVSWDYLKLATSRMWPELDPVVEIVEAGKNYAYLSCLYVVCGAQVSGSAGMGVYFLIFADGGWMVKAGEVL